MKRISFIIVLTCICLTAKSQYNKGVVLETVLKTDTTSIGQKIVYPTFASDEVSIIKVTLPPGKSTGWHKHFFPVFAYVLKGTLTVEVENKKTLQFPVNSSFSEVINTLHNGVNNGKEDVVLIAFFMGEKDKPLSVH
ncbi:MAG TPA: cupin domain-containing protein [Paludibacter sp.]|jgi:quercetin dioxygenase-like cupin family protein